MAKTLYRHKLLIKTLDRLECGIYTGLDMYWCINAFDWLRKFKKIDAAEIDRITNQILRIRGYEND